MELRLINGKGNPAAGQRLSVYLSLGLGAGVLGSQSAAGQIVYSNIAPITISPGQIVYFQPTTGLAATNRSLLTGGVGYGALNFNSPHYIYTGAYSLNMNTVASQPSGTQIDTSRLSLGTPIGSSSVWHAGSFTYLDVTHPPLPPWTTANSGWATGADGTTGYIGLQFDASNASGTNYNYGWAEVTYNASSQTLTLDGFAYDATPGETIDAGMTAVPEPANATLLLAIGAAGLVALRRMRKTRSAVAASDS